MDFILCVMGIISKCFSDQNKRERVSWLVLGSGVDVGRWPDPGHSQEVWW